MKRATSGHVAAMLDLAMCGLMNGVQFRHRLPPASRVAVERYIERCAGLTPEAFYALPANGQKPDLVGSTLAWPSPVTSAFAENNRVCVDLFPSPHGASAPTVMILHALMSASARGYQRTALRFNALGWNACFVHLPYHYSRRPRGFLNGEHAITADMVRNAETLRQGVIELRQLMAWLRAQGCAEFGLLATSYGAWVGALLSFVEEDFRFIALMTPIVDVSHAIWDSGATMRLRSELRRHGIERELVEKHYHLSSPLHHTPLAGGDKAVLVAGRHDRIARAGDVEELHRRWKGSQYQSVAQGHFGYSILPFTMRVLMRTGLLRRL
jgi:GNAT superfamily N-acetyltransferase